MFTIAKSSKILIPSDFQIVLTEVKDYSGAIVDQTTYQYYFEFTDKKGNKYICSYDGVDRVNSTLNDANQIVLIFTNYPFTENTTLNVRERFIVTDALMPDGVRVIWDAYSICSIQLYKNALDLQTEFTEERIEAQVTLIYRDGYTPKFEIGNVYSSPTAQASVDFKEFDTDGTPIYTISFGLQQGEQGIQGIQGIQGERGYGIVSVTLTNTSANGLELTYRMLFEGGYYKDYVVTNGNAITSINKTNSVGLVDTYTITFQNGTTTTFDVANGQGYTEKGLWSNIVNYVPYDVVHNTYGVFVCKVANINHEPTTTDTYWEMIINNQTPTFQKATFNPNTTEQLVNVGDVAWDAPNHTVSIQLENGVTLQLGQELPIPIKAVGNILNGDIIQYVGAQGDHILGKKAVPAEIIANPELIMGMATADIANNDFGYVTFFGRVHDVYTNGYAEGTILYFDQVNGNYTDVEPTSGVKIIIGIVSKEATGVGQNNGIIAVNPQIVQLFDDELDINSPNALKNSVLTNIYELTKEPSGFIEGSAITKSYDWTTRKVTLTGDLKYMYRGQEKTLTSPFVSDAHPNTTGKWFLYSTDGETFVWSQVSWSFFNIQVAAVSFDATDINKTFAICETHGIMQYQVHDILHNLLGTFLVSGLKPTAGSYAENTATDAANSMGFDAGVIQDEDLRTAIPQWVDGTYTTMYIGSGGTSVFNLASSLPFIAANNAFIQLNNVATGAMAAGQNLRYYNVYQIVIPTTSDTISQKYRTIMLQPQKEYTSLSAAQNEVVSSLSLGSLATLSPEFIIHSRITYVTSQADTNTGKCRIATGGISYVYGSKVSQFSITNVLSSTHSALSNLAWLISAHFGNINKVAGFGESGQAIEYDFTQVVGSGTTAIMSQKAVTDLANNYNVTNSVPLSAGQYYTLTTAIAAVPSALRKIGFEITFESAAGVWETYQFKGVIENWSVLGSWSNDLRESKKFTNRVLADGGIVASPKFVEDVFDTHRDLLPNMKLCLIPHCGVKTDTTAGSTTISKLYDLSANNNDAVQATKANQPFLGGFIAPNEKYSFGNEIEVTAKSLTHTTISFASSGNYSICLSVKLYKYGQILTTGSGNGLSLNKTQVILSKNDGSFGVIMIADGSKLELNKTNTIVITYNNGLYTCTVNGYLYNISSQVTYANNFSIIYLADSYINAKVKYYSILNKTLEAKEIQDLTAFLQTSFPDIESIPVGNQQIATSNFEGIVNANGDTIQNDTSNTNTEVLINGNMESISSWVGHNGASLSQVIATRTGGSGTYSLRTTTNAVYAGTKQEALTNGMPYILTGWVRSDGTQIPAVWLGGASSPYWIGTNSTNWQYFEIKARANDSKVYLTTTQASAGYLEWDDVSVLTAAWSDSTAIYNNAIIRGLSEYNACKEAAMWRYYNNEVTKGATHEKEYNDYARYVLDYYPPQGYHFETLADYNQMASLLASKVGAKIKAKYGIFVNAFATNETGYTLLANGYIDELGNSVGFEDYAVINYGGNYYKVANNSNDLVLLGTNRAWGACLRLQKNSPYGDVDKEETTGYFTTNIAAGVSNKDLTVPFGYRIASIRVESISALTNFKCDLYSTSGALQDTLLTGKSVSANIPQTFIVTADHKTQATNPFLRFNATGNTGMRIYVQLIKTIIS